MNKVGKILLGATLLIIVFWLSAFGMYKYSQIKAFDDLVSQGKQYMIKKDYDKAIQVFQQALTYKKDADVQTNIALAQNLKNEDGKKGTISKNIQLANEAAKNNKYDEANKYLDEILKVDSNNADAKNLKDIFAKAVQDQQEKVKAQEEKDKALATAKNQEDDYIHKGPVYIESHGGVTYNQALTLAKERGAGLRIEPVEKYVDQATLKKNVPAHSLENSYIFYAIDDVHQFDCNYLIEVSKSTGRIFYIYGGKSHKNIN